MTAVTLAPSASPSSRTASTVIEATTRLPPTSSTTLAIAAPSSMDVIVAGGRVRGRGLLRALSFMRSSLVKRDDPNGLRREDRPRLGAVGQAKCVELLGRPFDDHVADAQAHAPALGRDALDGTRQRVEAVARVLQREL